MSPTPSNREPTRDFITGLVVIAATIIGFFGFARLSFGWTIGVSIAALAGLLTFFWWTGQRKRRGRGERQGF